MADGMFSSAPQPLVEFVKLIPDGRAPKRADRTAAGFVPSRAMRYCDALTAATGQGYWVFPVVDMQLLWDGEQIVWSYGEDERWLPLSGTASGAVQYPGFEEQFHDAAPGQLHGFSPPFLTAVTEPGTVQLWTGLVARTRPGWSLAIRQPVNLPATPGLNAWEGIVETDQWFGPLFTLLRITKTDCPVRLRSYVPFLQIIPVPQLAYRDEVLSQVSVRGMEAMTDDEWSDLGGILAPDPEVRSRPGSYSVGVRKRRGCPFHAATVQAAVEAS